EVSGRPLRCVDFTGYSPEVPHLLSTAFERPRVRLPGDPALARICDERGTRLRAAGSSAAPPRYAFSLLPDGRHIDARMRPIYLDALRDAARSGAEEPPSPLGPDRDHPS